MERITSTDAVGVLPVVSESGTTGYFTNGDPGVPTPATTVTAEWLNRVQEEIAGVIEDAGLTLDGADNTQLLQAIDAKVAPIASEAEVLAATSVTKTVTPGRMKKHPGVAKKLIRFAGRGTDGQCTVDMNHGGTARVERVGQGYYRVLFSTTGSGDDMPDDDYLPQITVQTLDASADGTTVGTWGAAISGTLTNCVVGTVMQRGTTGLVMKIETVGSNPFDPAFVNLAIYDDN